MLTAIYHIMNSIVNKLFGSLRSNSLKKYSTFVEQVNQLENKISNLDDNELKKKTNLLATFFNFSPLI